MKKICRCGFESENPAFVECPVCKEIMEALKPRLVTLKVNTIHKNKVFCIDMTDSELLAVKKVFAKINEEEQDSGISFSVCEN